MGTGARVYHAIVLNVRAVANADKVHVTTHSRIAPDRRLLADLHVTNHLRTLINVSRIVNLRLDRAKWSNHRFRNSNTTLFRIAGGSPAVSTKRELGQMNWKRRAASPMGMMLRIFALRAHCGRDARGPLPSLCYLRWLC